MINFDVSNRVVLTFSKVITLNAGVITELILRPSTVVPFLIICCLRFKFVMIRTPVFFGSSLILLKPSGLAFNSFIAVSVDTSSNRFSLRFDSDGSASMRHTSCRK